MCITQSEMVCVSQHSQHPSIIVPVVHEECPPSAASQPGLCYHGVQEQHQPMLQLAIWSLCFSMASVKGACPTASLQPQQQPGCMQRCLIVKHQHRYFARQQAARLQYRQATWSSLTFSSCSTPQSSQAVSTPLFPAIAGGVIAFKPGLHCGWG